MVNEKIVKAYAFCPKDQWAVLPKMPESLRSAIIREVRSAPLPPRRAIDLEGMSDIGICWALVTTWSLLFVKKALGKNALKQALIRTIRRNANS